MKNISNPFNEQKIKRMFEERLFLGIEYCCLRLYTMVVSILE
jgi:hypothetical protein